LEFQPDHFIFQKCYFLSWMKALPVPAALLLPLPRPFLSRPGHFLSGAVTSCPKWPIQHQAKSIMSQLVRILLSATGQNGALLLMVAVVTQPPQMAGVSL
jgi:hypothetical protein